MSRQQVNRARAKGGASLVIVVCVSAFLVAFALAMVYTAGLMLSQANQRLRQERSRQLARSFSQVLYEELKKGGRPADASDTFYRFVSNFLESDSYQDYDPNHPDDTVYHYQVDATVSGAVSPDYGKVTVALYKEGGEDTELTGTIVYGAVGIDDPLVAVAGSVRHATLTVAVTAEVDGMSYTYSTDYEQIAYYEDGAVTFIHDPTGTPIQWKRLGTSGKWVEAAMAGNDFTVNNGDSITFTVTPGLGNLKECKYTKAIPEDGDPAGSGGSGGVTP